MMRLAIGILWPSFLVAIIAEGFFFSMFDPHDMIVVGTHVELPVIAAYTVGFFFFWIFCALASMLTYYLLNVPNDRRHPRI